MERGEEAQQVAAGRAEPAFVEIADIEIGEAVLAAIGAEILQMQIAVQPDAGELAELLRESIVEEMGAAAKESEGVLRHAAIFARQQGRGASLVAGNQLVDQRCRTCHLARIRWSPYAPWLSPCPLFGVPLR